MSSAIIGNSLYNLIQDIEGFYLDYSRENSGGYDGFYTSMADVPIIANTSSQDTSSGKADKERKNNMIYATQKVLMYKFATLCGQYNQLKLNEDRMTKAQTKSLKFMKAAFTTLYVILTVLFLMIVVAVMRVSVKSEPIKALQTSLMFFIVWLIITTLYGILLNFLDFRVKEVRRMARRTLDSFSRYYTFIGLDGEILGVMVYLKMKQGRKVAEVKKLKEALTRQIDAKLVSDNELMDDNILLMKRWQRIWGILQKLHASGEGAKVLGNMELASSNVKILKNVNEVLSPYYDLMLRSRQRFADSSTKDGIMKIIDMIVVDELRKSDVYKLDNSESYDDATFKKILHSGQHYQMYMTSFWYMMLYMYPIYKKEDYGDFLLYEKHVVAGEPLPPGITMTDETKAKIAGLLVNDDIMKVLTSRFPIDRSNYEDELYMIEELDNTPDGNARREIVDKFITLSASTFSKNYMLYNSQMLTVIKKLPLLEQRKDTYNTYVSKFISYFEELADNVVQGELADLNPKATQYLIFDKSYMRAQLVLMVTSSPILKELPMDYVNTMMDVMMDNIIPVLQKRHSEKYFDYTSPSNAEKNLRVLKVNKQLKKAVDNMSKHLVPYEFKLADYGKYITRKVTEDTRSTEAVTAAIDTIINQVDYEVNMQRGLLRKTLGEEAAEARFVAKQDFVTNLNGHKYNTLVSALRVDLLQELVSSLNPTDEFTQEESFGRSRYSLTNAKFIYKMLLVCVLPAYILYALGVGQDAAGDEQLKSNVKSIDALLQSDRIWVNVLKFATPLAGAMLVLAVFSSYIAKAQANIDYNRERMQENTDEVKRSTDALKRLIDGLSFDIGANSSDEAYMPIKDVKEFDEIRKEQMYTKMKEILIAYDRCNYIVGTNKYQLPFPYAEVIADGVMIAMILGVLGYTVFNFAPVSRMVELKDLYEYKEQSETLVNDPTFVQEIITRAVMHGDEVKTVTFTVKSVSALSIIVFMVFYSLTIVANNGAYKNGLYNSAYFANKACCDD